MILSVSASATTTDQANNMTTGYMKVTTASVACLLALALSSCGESDLVELHERELDDAVAELEPPEEITEETDAQMLSPELDLSQFELTFSDEFNGAEINEEKWNTSLFGPETVIFEQLQYYVDTQDPDETIPSPFVFDGEHLSIVASTTPDDLRNDVNGQRYLSGILTTRERFTMRYGYVETRVDLPAGRGTWPSLWMLAADSAGRSPEVYIFEYDGGRADSIFHNYNYVDDEGNLRSPSQQESEVAGISEGFHTFGMRWTPSEMLFYVNGQPSWRIIGENLPDEDMFLVLNLAMGGLWPGDPDDTTPDPAIFEIDYIRVYELIEQ